MTPHATPPKDADGEIDDIFEDLMVGHNFEYAAKAIKQLFKTHTANAALEDRIQHLKELIKRQEKYIGLTNRAPSAFSDGEQEEMERTLGWFKDDLETLEGPTNAK